MLRYIIENKIDLKRLTWIELHTFNDRTYYIPEDYHLWVMNVLSFTDSEDTEIGRRFIYPGRFISIKIKNGKAEVSIPVEEPIYPNDRYWREASIDEALWLSNRLGIRIAVESEALHAVFSATCVYERRELEELQRLEAARIEAAQKATPDSI